MIEGFNQPQIESLDSLFKNCFSIPVFQRPYSWGTEEIGELFADIDEYFQSDKDENLFMGTIYMSIDKQIKSSIFKYSIIDGQQRLTTLSFICLLLYHHAVRLGIEQDENVVLLKGFLWKKTEGRTINKNQPLLTSSAIEENVVKFIFDTIFTNAGSDKLFDKMNTYTTENKQEEKVLSNLKSIDNKIKSYIIKNDKGDGELLLDYIDFLIYNLKFITITVGKGNEKKLFEIFESINSKGKQLDQIDLIKSYIFQNIDGEDYDTYLGVWGNLIKETKDQLEDYMYIFIKSYIKFYKVGLSAKYFKSSSEELMRYYQKDNLSETFKCFLDDMNEKVKYYKTMIDKNEFLINNNKFKFYTNCLRLLEYEHPNPIIFRAYCEFGTNKLDKKGLTEVIKACFVYMFSFQTISNRDSKDAIKTFEKIINDMIFNDFNYMKIIEGFKNSLILDGINKKYIENNIINFAGYSEKNEKGATRVLLTAFEFSTNGKLDYDKGNYVLMNRDTIQIDHILPQKPEKSDPKCKYYFEGPKGNEILKLKEGHDLNIPGILSDMSYLVFQTQILDKIGNLRLIWRDENIDKSNKIVNLKNYSTFNTYAQISKRATSLSSKLAKNEIFNL